MYMNHESIGGIMSSPELPKNEWVQEIMDGKKVYCINCIHMRTFSAFTHLFMSEKIPVEIKKFSYGTKWCSHPKNLEWKDTGNHIQPNMVLSRRNKIVVLNRENCCSLYEPKKRIKIKV